MAVVPIFEWDERKRRSNLRKHGLDFADCAVVFAGPTWTIVDDRWDYGETRFLRRGLLRGRVVVVTHTESGALVRIISMRKAATHEKEDFFKNTFQD
jgi:uncharacterized DUF497 family protein